MPATELLFGLWLRSLKPRKCEETVTEWRAVLTARSADNDNASAEAEADKARAVALLDAACATCLKDCPRRFMIRAPRPTEGRRESLLDTCR